MAIHPLKSAAVLLLASGTIAAGLGAPRARSRNRRKPTTAGRRQPRRAGSRRREARFEAIGGGSGILRLRLEEVTNSRGLEASGLPSGRARPGRSSRSARDSTMSWSRRSSSRSARSVKKGDPLLVIRSAELAQAKNDCRTRFVQWDHDRKFLKAREPLAKDGRITKLVWTETQNDEKKSRLDYLVARDKLATYGMTDEEIDKLLEEPRDEPNRRIMRPTGGPRPFKAVDRSTVHGVVVGANRGHEKQLRPEQRPDHHRPARRL